MKKLVVALLIGVFVFAGVSSFGSQEPAAAQDGLCPALVENALAVTENLCDGIGRNEACYGHTALQAEPQPDIASFTFDTEGDVEPIDQIRTLRLSLMDVDNGLWGVSLLRLQASYLASQPDDNVTMVLFGGIELENHMTNEPTLEATVSADSKVNVRLGPSATDRVIGSVLPGQVITATGRSQDGEWTRIVLPATGTTGWVANWLITSENDLATLDVVDGSAKYYGPMQAFTLNTGPNDTVCDESPGNGLLIQTPEGAAKVTLLINEVDVQVGSTVYFTAEAGSEMAIYVIEGAARVTVDDEVQIARAGTALTVPMDANLAAAGPPTSETAFDVNNPVLQALPLLLLPQEVEVVPFEEPIIDTGDPDEPQVAMCHYPPGNPDNPETIVVGASAVAAHLAHGDTEGACPGDEPPVIVEPPPTEEPGEEPFECAAPKVAVCHEGESICIAAAAVDAHLEHGDTLGACP